MANPLSNFLGNTQQTNLIKTILSKGVQPRTMVLNYMKMPNIEEKIDQDLIIKVLNEIKDSLNKSATLVSMAAGVKIKSIEDICKTIYKLSKKRKKKYL